MYYKLKIWLFCKNKVIHFSQNAHIVGHKREFVRMQEKFEKKIGDFC